LLFSLFSHGKVSTEVSTSPRKFGCVW